MSNVLFWFRRDLRLNDNTALFEAIKSGMPVVPVFVFDTAILNQLDDKRDKRVHFIHQRLVDLNTQLQAYQSGLVVRCGCAQDVIVDLCDEFDASHIYCNEDYEPQAITRDTTILNIALAKNIIFNSFKDQVVFAKNDVLKPDGKPYTIFTPYSKKWKSLLYQTSIVNYESELLLNKLFKTTSLQLPSMADIGFEPTNVRWEAPLLSDCVLKDYAETRNLPANEQGTSHLSVHLRFGTVSVRQLVQKAASTSEQFLNELIWREFFMMILFHFPKVTKLAFKSKYDDIPWRRSEADFECWCIGQTGYPLVDAGMRELNATGLMHNRVRMVVASFLVKHLLIDWRWGEAYFAQKLLDYDLSANNGNWQWVVGCGCDAAPYFRVFNPTEQLKKFDPDFKYTRRWVPELDELVYVKPIVEHAFVRNRALEVFKKALT